ncbi:UNVERIFIED_CONTAM: hypothetical protein RMT77_011799 [Armadillidium vulgare]
MKLEKLCEVSEEKRHTVDIEAITLSGDRLFSGADDGVVKIWRTNDLELTHEFKAHDYAINHLLIFQDRLLTASMDQTIKSWQLDVWKLVATFEGHEESPRRLATDGEFIYSGADNGEVLKWTKDGKLLLKFAIVEEVWDLHVQGLHVYTIRDRGLTISECVPNSPNYSVLRSLEGRAPFYIKDKYLLMMNREGTVINHFKNERPSYDYVQELIGHERIVTAMAGFKDFLLSSGYDEKLFIWDLKTGNLLCTEALNGCPVCLVARDEDNIFVAGPNGLITKFKLSS